MTRFADRAAAGRDLARHLAAYAEVRDAIVLGLARGGVPVAAEVARALGLPLDVFLVRKLGVPGHEELAMGALASGGVRVVNQEVVDELGLPPKVIEAAAVREQAELERRERAYRGGRPPVEVAGRVVLLVDDGLATGTSMRAAVQGLSALGAERIVVAGPVAPGDAGARLDGEADELVCAHTPEPFGAVGIWYEDFTQTTDEEVRRALAQAAPGGGSSASGRAPVRPARS